MKITGGALKGRNVEARKDHSLRPTTSRVREAIFNLLIHGKFLKDEHFKSHGQDIIKGQHVVDIFCGTGILGLEAISRGAEHATLIDGDSRTIDIARQNVRNLEANAWVIRSDSTRLPRAKKQCTLAFMDPPYNSKLVVPALKSLRDQDWLTDGAIVVIENEKKEKITPPEGFTTLDERLYGKTRLTLMQYARVTEKVKPDYVNQKRNSAFTLVELALVITIIGLLAAGIVAGNSLMYEARVRSVISKIQKYNVSINVFSNKFKALPGDIRNAQTIWSACTDRGQNACNGNGDGVIQSSGANDAEAEGIRAWQHLSLAGLVDGSFTGVREPGDGLKIFVGKNVPSMPLRNAGLRIRYTETVSWLQNAGHYFQLGRENSMQLDGPIFTPEEAHLLDLKIDDGTSSTGKVEMNSGGSGMPCITLDGPLGSGWNYDLAVKDTVCTLIFFW